MAEVSRRQRPLVRAGSGEVHEARLAVLEGRFSEDTKARCSWCNIVRQAKQGEWLEILISSPGSGIRPAYVFRCLECEAAPVSAATTGIVAVPRGSRAPGDKPRPATPKLSNPLPNQLDPLTLDPPRNRTSPKRSKAMKSPAPKAPDRPRVQKRETFPGAPSPAGAG
ncbi:MAG: hypothetical protein ACR2FO_07030 [Actinomycetota bacterium]